jgi:hypothetical protein
MNSILSLASLCLVVSIAPLSAASVVFSENFTSASMSTSWAFNIGGNSNNYPGFGQWVGQSEASITTGALRVAPTGGTRSAAIVLSHSDFAATGAGSYTLSFDVTAYSGASNNVGMVTVWTGSAYTYGNSANSLQLALDQAKLVASGAATASQLGSSVISSTDGGTQKTITFDYDGTGEIALFFGMNAVSWPHPVVTYDNIVLSKNSSAPIPEPSVTALAAGMVGAMCLVRRRKARENG